MAGILYLLFCMFFGIALNRLFIPGLGGSCLYSYSGKEIKMNKYLMIFPAGFLTGVIFVTWPVYLWASFFKNTSSPLGYANLTVFAAYAIIIVAVCIVKERSNIIQGLNNLSFKSLKGYFKEFDWLTLLYLMLALGLCIYLMYSSLIVIDNKYYIGVTVFSDFSPHIGMIRSFSYGNNYGPTVYEICAGDDIKYHFMFQFLVGNLEFLGMRLDHAFNLPSILCLFIVYIFIYILGYRLSGKKAVGILSGLLFTFRSSSSLLSYLGDFKSRQEIFEAIKTNQEFIGSTTNENWGLWNLNVYCNQRHICLGLALALFAVIIFIPYVYKGFNAVNEEKGFLKKFKCMFFSSGAWKTTSLSSVIFLGVLIGGLGFFNGACLIGLMIILFFMAIPSANKLDYLIMALIAGALSLFQTKAFIKGSALSFQFKFGFLAEHATFASSLLFLTKLLGVFIFVICIALVIKDSVSKYLILAFFMPIVFAFTVSLTPDIAVNHKYIIIAIMFLNVFVADIVVGIFEKKQFVSTILSLILVFALTCTGIFDLATLSRMNTRKRAIVLNVDDPLEVWVRDNLTSKDIVVSGMHYLNGGRGSYLITGGAMLYLGWPYFGWSAGYDTYQRDDYVRRIFGAENEKDLKTYVERTGCTYIAVDASVRDDSSYKLNEQLISSVYPLVYTEGDEHDAMNIYKVSK